MKLANYTQDRGDTVRLRFEDGTEATADLVVGCDGIHSNIRAQFRADNPRYSGRVAYRGLVPIKDLESWWPFPTYSASWLGPDKHFLVFPISRNKTLNIVGFVYSEGEHGMESWTATGSREDVAKEFESFEPTVRKTISLMQENPSKWILNDREPLDQWVFANGKIVLMGDAAHAVSQRKSPQSSRARKAVLILVNADAPSPRYLNPPIRANVYPHTEGE